MGLAFAALGVVAAVRRWRQWAFVLAFPTVMLVVLSTAEARWSRLLVPALGAIALLASLGFEIVVDRSPRLLTALVLVGALWPLVDSVAYVRTFRSPIRVTGPSTGSPRTSRVARAF